MKQQVRSCVAIALRRVWLCGCSTFEALPPAPTPETPSSASCVLSLARSGYQALYTAKSKTEPSCKKNGGYKDLTYDMAVITRGADERPLAKADIQDVDS